MTAGTLFDPATTGPTKCGHCGALREPGDDKTRHCTVDEARASGDWQRRPLECLNTHDPSTAGIPY